MKLTSFILFVIASSWALIGGSCNIAVGSASQAILATPIGQGVGKVAKWTKTGTDLAPDGTLDKTRRTLQSVSGTVSSVHKGAARLATASLYAGIADLVAAVLGLWAAVLVLLRRTWFVGAAAGILVLGAHIGFAIAVEFVWTFPIKALLWGGAIYLASRLRNTPLGSRT